MKIYRCIFLPVVLYGCESWSLALRKEYELGLCESREVRRVFGSRRKPVRGYLRVLHKEVSITCTPHQI